MDGVSAGADHKSSAFLEPTPPREKHPTRSDVEVLEAAGGAGDAEDAEDTEVAIVQAGAQEVDWFY